MDHKTSQQKMKFILRDKVIVSVVSFAFFLSGIYVIYHSMTPEWKLYQDEFKSVVEEKLGDQRAQQIQSGLQQIYVKDIGVVDRCVTCHLGMEWKGMENAGNPFRSHPEGILKNHPIERFGCTPCHGGQGYATDMEGAHGFVEHWEAPLLGQELSEFYVVGDKKMMMQMNCNICHRYDKETAGMGVINKAKRLINEKGCRACHVINGRGGTVGPDLTFEGEKSAEQFNYERIKGFASMFTWHVTHFKNPKELVAETVMPSFGFASADAQALALLVMSWKKTKLPVNFIPSNNFRDVPSREEVEKEERMKNGPGAFFVKRQCFVCHSVSSLEVEAAAQIGPDLALAVEDVQSRFGRTLDDFLMKPTGTMEVVLSTMIPLTKEERLEAIGKLRHAYELKQIERKSKKIIPE